MNPAKKTFGALFSGLFVLLATLALPFNIASAGELTGNSIHPANVSELETKALLEIYGLEDEVEVNNITIKIYNADDNLIYSTEVCQKDYDCDDRLINFINQSDFITEVDNTRIYYLDQ